jgi:hypothetical protein
MTIAMYSKVRVWKFSVPYDTFSYVDDLCIESEGRNHMSRWADKAEMESLWRPSKYVYY